MLKVTIYNTITGEFGAMLNATNESELDFHLGENQAYIEGHYRAKEFILDIPTMTVASKEVLLADVKEKLWRRVKRRRFIEEQGGCMTPLGEMDTNDASQRKINGAVTMALIANLTSSPYLESWTMKDNSIVDHDANAMISAGIAVGQHVANCHAIANGLRGLIDTATTIVEVQAIDIESADWP